MYLTQISYVRNVENCKRFLTIVCNSYNWLKFLNTKETCFQNGIKMHRILQAYFLPLFKNGAERLIW